jgi:hypothetical protein
VRASPNPNPVSSPSLKSELEHTHEGHSHRASRVAARLTLREGVRRVNRANLTAMVIGWVITGMLGITLSYHRQLAHKAFQTPKWLEYALAYCGVMAMQGDPLEWVSSHRYHHLYCDTPQDPHTPYEGFWWSHCGWFLDIAATVSSPSNPQPVFCVHWASLGSVSVDVRVWSLLVPSRTSPTARASRSESECGLCHFTPPRWVVSNDKVCVSTHLIVCCVGCYPRITSWLRSGEFAEQGEGGGEGTRQERRVGNRSNAADMAAQPFYTWIQKTYGWHIVAAALATYLIGGWGGFVWAFALRVCWVHHITVRVCAASPLELIQLNEWNHLPRAKRASGHVLGSHAARHQSDESREFRQGE